jgi:hypothetical protein
MSAALCGLESMVVDRRYLIFVCVDGSQRVAGLCGGTAPATSEQLNAVEQLTGAPARPAVVANDTAAPGFVARAASNDEAAQFAVPKWTIGTASLIGVAAFLGAGRHLRRRLALGRAPHD